RRGRPAFHGAARPAGPRGSQSRNRRAARRKPAQALPDNVRERREARVAESETIRQDCRARLRRDNGRTERELSDRGRARGEAELSRKRWRLRRAFAAQDRREQCAREEKPW